MILFSVVPQDVLHDVPDFEERKKLLSELKNRLEALLSPQLISAFQSHSLSEAQRCVQIFTSIQRYPQLKNYYVGCHKVSNIHSLGPCRSSLCFEASLMVDIEG